MTADQHLEAVVNHLRRELGDPTLVRNDPASKYLYSTDASIYQVHPAGVVFPRDCADLSAIVSVCASYQMPIIARGAGSGLGGQAIGAGMVIDCARFLTRIIDLDPANQRCTLEPGVVLNSLNAAAKNYDLQFGPDPASAERATLGGSLANNATGAHSIQFGMAADHLLEAETVLSDGNTVVFKTISIAEAQQKAVGNTREAAIYAAALGIRIESASEIIAHWPKVWRRASGYNLNYLLPWSPVAPQAWAAGAYPPIQPGTINLAALLAGSEGTLGIIQQATVNLVPLPRSTCLGLLEFASIGDACDAAPELLERGPSAIELIPRTIVDLAQSIPAFANQLNFLGTETRALLVVEFSGEDPVFLRQKVAALGKNVTIIEAPGEQKKVWAVRKAGLGIVQSRPGDVKPVAFMEDLVVPVDLLGTFIRAIETIFKENGLEGEIYAHASAGCLHIRPLINLKSASGRSQMRQVVEQAVSLVLNLDGAVSGEHGDGLARSEWIEKAYGADITRAFRRLKQAADPQEILNPGKIVGLTPATQPPPMDVNLRYDAEYQPQAWEPGLSFQREHSLVNAIEQCNGAGVCRKAEGVMCPSFQVSQDEKHNTRGRANLLRGLVAGSGSPQEITEKDVYAALDLCLACKGCKAECPSSVDMAKLRYEFLDHFYQNHRRRGRDYLFGYIDRFVRLGNIYPRFSNALLTNPAVKGVMDRQFGVSNKRPFPGLARRSFHQLAPRRFFDRNPFKRDDRQPVLLLMDAFNEFFYPDIALATIEVLEAAGCTVKVLPMLGAGRTLISKGFLTAAKVHARKLIELLNRMDPTELAAVVGIEPSEIYTLKDEYRDLLPDAAGVERLAGRAWMIDEYLVRVGEGWLSRKLRIADNSSSSISELKSPSTHVLLHGHCYQKAQAPARDGQPVGVEATRRLLSQAGYSVEVIDAGCCGMAGAFGYESEHFDFSSQVGELKLFPAIRKALPEWLVAASGVSCHAQIEDGVQRKIHHPIELVRAKIHPPV